ncbi:MAG: carboxypeptidase regulatory-like domain-containing protein [Candidatus Sulfotelmatobacter sp.]
MQNVPKIVRERLKAATPAVNHPDADLLTSFAEHSLPVLERDIVLEHLARCGDCRDVVALALPATEPVQTVVSPSPSGWLTWPTLRWAFVTAGVIAIASFGVLQYQKSARSTTMAYKASAPQTTDTEAKNQPVPLPAAPARAEKRDKILAPPAPAFADSGDATSLMIMPSPGHNFDQNADQKKSVSRAQAVPTPPAPQQPGGAVGHIAAARTLGGPLFGPRAANQFQQQNMAQNQAPVPAPPGASGKQQAGGAGSENSRVSAGTQTVEASGAASLAQTENLDAHLAQNQPSAQPSSSEDSVYPAVGKAKAPVPLASGAEAGNDGAPIQDQALRSRLTALAVPGQIGGYVVDPTGAVVPNARITIIPSKPGAPATAVTNSQGLWLIAGLPTGSYKAQAEAPGFRTTVATVNYDANQPSMYRFTLNVGSVAETVEVSGQASLIMTEAATAAAPLTSREASQPGMNGRNVNQMMALSPLWAITSKGALRRSVDQGKTWHDVDVKANPASLASASVAVTAQVSRAKAKDKDADRALKQQATALTFRAVAAAGAEVWVGGSGGALYHSADAGIHWTRVVPAASGSVLTGDITSVEFPDPQHGKVSTSTAEVWTTRDNGQTWQKQ